MAESNVADIGITSRQAEAPRFAGLSDKQVLKVFGEIATKVDLMADLCIEHAERAGDGSAAVAFHALETMLRGVGALADMPTGGSVVGGLADWMCGPLFHEPAN